MKFIPPSDENWIQGPGYRKQVLLNADELAAPGTLVQMIIIEPDTHVPMHYHKHTMEVFHMLEGVGEMSIGGQSITFKPGDTVTCEPGDLHSAYNPGPGIWRYIVFKTNAQPDDSYWLEDL